ncbi:MAG TPA: GNAT family N-acetyltransferase [Pyrinomonadaceae bacterium]|nr:GNAT family N-acetyltransferase [Pyrinomonadaceae bacterium]
MNEVTLETERLILRMWRNADFEEYAELCADPEVMRFLGGKVFDRTEAWRQMASMIGHWYLRDYGVWAVEEKDSGRLAGRIGCINPEGWPGFEVGWTLKREFWGKGYATEAGRRALEYGFNELDKPHIISLIHPENRASIRVAERLGETLEGNARVFDTDVLVYGIDRP